MPVFTLSDRLSFPPAHMATREGLLAVGGDLSVDRLVLAYRKGIFPWYASGEPVLWWSPHPRLVLFPNELKISRSLKKVIRKGVFHITLNADFRAVIRACAEIPRSYGDGTWITDEMQAAYDELHRHGYVHSVEAWQDGTLVGGLYGVKMGQVFFGESMFTHVSNASKVAFVRLVEWLAQLDVAIIDCQMKTDHLMRFGAREISRKIFLEIISDAVDVPVTELTL